MPVRYKDITTVDSPLPTLENLQKFQNAATEATAIDRNMFNETRNCETGIRAQIREYDKAERDKAKFDMFLKMYSMQILNSSRAWLLNTITDDVVAIKNIGAEQKPLDLPPLKYE